jgi:hypothetical protein
MKSMSLLKLFCLVPTVFFLVCLFYFFFIGKARVWEDFLHFPSSFAHNTEERKSLAFVENVRMQFKMMFLE